MPYEDGFKTLFEDPSMKCYLWMGHIIQVMNQNTAIKDLMVKINDNSCVCMVVVEFNIKLETMNRHKNSVKNL